jgi:chromosome partitioning protein
MGFLSRRSKPEAEPQVEGSDAAEQPAEAQGAPQSPPPAESPESSPETQAVEPQPAEQTPEPVEGAPDGEGEIRISKGGSNGNSQTASAPTAVSAPPRPSEPERREPMRLRPEELIAPSRHQAEEEADPVKTAKVISFANQKGGVAKTTTTLNLAVAFAESGHRVLCIDLDPQGNLTMSQGVDPDKVDKSMYDVLVHDIPLAEVIAEREIDIAVASIDLAGAEIAMSTKIGRERSLEKALKPELGNYDFVCIDTPPSLGLLTINALTASNKVIVPVQCEYLSMRGLVQLQNTLKMIQENLNPGVEIEGILPTMLDSRTVHAKEAVEILEENFGDLVFKSRIRKAIKFAEAPVRGASVLKYDPDGNAASYYRDLAKEVLSNGST